MKCESAWRISLSDWTYIGAYSHMVGQQDDAHWSRFCSSRLKLHSNITLYRGWVVALILLLFATGLSKTLWILNVMVVVFSDKFNITYFPLFTKSNISFFLCFLVSGHIDKPFRPFMPKNHQGFTSDNILHWTEQRRDTRSDSILNLCFSLRKTFCYSIRAYFPTVALLPLLPSAQVSLIALFMLSKWS